MLRAADEHAESDEVAKAIVTANAAGTPWKEIAVLYRMNALSRVVEDALRRRQIPYRIVRGTAFYDRKEVKDLMAYLRLVANAADDVACGRIVNVPTRGIGDSSLTRIERIAAVQQIPMLAALRFAREAGVADRTARKIDEFASMLARWRQVIELGEPDALAAFVEMVLDESGLRDFADGTDGDDQEQRRLNLTKPSTPRATLNYLMTRPARLQHCCVRCKGSCNPWRWWLTPMRMTPTRDR